VASNDEGVAIGRTFRDAPDIDGKVFVKTNQQVSPGDLLNIRITKGLEYDLEADAIS